MTDQDTEFTADAAVEHCRRHGVVPTDADATARALGGGVSNHVYEVTWDDGCVVVKRPLPNLAVADDWPADVDRVHNEAAAIRTYESVLAAAGVGARVPGVVCESDDHVIAIECAPTDAPMWKRELLDGRVDAGVAATVGAVLGAVHDATADDPTVRETFSEKRPFDQLRVDPYHRATARRNPDVADAIRTEIDRILATDRALVHGDYSPKNVLVDRAAGTVPWILDFEVAHWGDPAFDTAFMLNHLYIKSIYNHDRHAAYADAATRFWDAYDDAVRWDIERETVTELAVLMLARVDGKSPVEYVEREAVAGALRRVAKRTLRSDTRTLSAFAALARGEAAAL
ncbi:phosphotransferase family protein [Haloplanus pelagicus]|jgi:5-methylthioribose kinase|uniref:phosphotransferase family protein n=1 Tax=Haloplanus pelagicus TaxID=2949995 RepID=UPI00203A5871|nr:aminoglycoside phosphotransferase family protein [Haloplanus sp. HW8-1]